MDEETDQAPPFRPSFRRHREIATRASATLRPRLAAILGSLALALVAVAFAKAGELSQHLFLMVYTRWHWAPLIATPLLFALTVGVTRKAWPLARGSGIPQVMAASRKPESERAARLLSLDTALAKVVGTLLVLLGGGSAGREGPTVQLSAAIMAAIHRWLRVPVTSGVVIAGGAAGVAAAFNTPLAGVAFAIEELAAAFEQKVAVLVMAAVMVAGLTSMGLAGDYVYFGAVTAGLDLREILPVSMLAGVLGGTIGGGFSRILIAVAWARDGWIARAKARPLLLAAGCGLIVAVTGVATGGVTWGTGYETTHALLVGNAAPLAFGPAKFLASLATALSGAPGGIFAPSLSVGAGLGHLLGQAFPSSPGSAIVLLGIAGYFAGVVRAPLTTVIIVMEMTADRGMILPLFATALIADGTSALISPHKLYHALSRQFMRDV